MPTSVAAGDQTCVISTEHTLATNTSGISVVLVLDLNALVNGDVVEVRLYTKCRSGGTERVAYVRSFANAQAEPIKYSVPVPADISVKATLKQTAGTGRVVPWSLLQL